MATLAAAAARRAAYMARISTPRTPAQPASLVQRRGLSGAADHHGPPKVNCWQEPMNPGQMEGRTLCNCLFNWLGSALLWGLQALQWWEERRAIGRSSSLSFRDCNHLRIFMVIMFSVGLVMSFDYVVGEQLSS